jgi:hypothetical protein
MEIYLCFLHRIDRENCTFTGVVLFPPLLINKYKLSIFQTRTQRSLFGPKKESVTEDGRNNEEHQAGYKVSVGKHERKGLYGRLKHM